MYRIISLLLVSFLFIGCSPMYVRDAVPVNKVPNVSDIEDHYFVQVGDRLRIDLGDLTGRTTITGNPEPIELPVRPDGKVLLPLLQNPVLVAGYTTEEVQKNLIRSYRQYVRDPNILVNISEFSPREVYVVGEVTREPETVPYKTSLTALRAVSVAGYDVLRANLHNIIVVRSQGAEKKPLVMSLDIYDAITNRDIKQDIKLMPNDVVVIPKKGIVALNDFIDQYINRNVPLPGLVYGISAIYAADKIVNRD